MYEIFSNETTQLRINRLTLPANTNLLFQRGMGNIMAPSALSRIFFSSILRAVSSAALLAV